MISWTYDGLQNVSDAIGNFFAVCGAGGTTAQCGPAVPTTCNPGVGMRLGGREKLRLKGRGGRRTAQCGPAVPPACKPGGGMLGVKALHFGGD